MPTYTWDVSSPDSTDAVSGYPTNEQTHRAMVAAFNNVEHDQGEGRHTFGMGSEINRDTITTWANGAIWFNTSRVSGETLLDVYDSGLGDWVSTGFGLIDVAQSWSAIQSATYVAMGTTASALDLDWSDGHYQKYTMDGNYTLGAGTNKPASGEGASIILELSTGTGGYTLDYNAEYLFQYGTDPVLTTTAGTVDILQLTLLSGGSVMVTALLDVS